MHDSPFGRTMLVLGQSSIPKAFFLGFLAEIRSLHLSSQQRSELASGGFMRVLGYVHHKLLLVASQTRRQLDDLLCILLLRLSL